MKLRLIIALVLITLVSTACGSGSSAVPPQPARKAATWRPPTPFPPMQYPTQRPTPGLPPGLVGRTPAVGALPPVEYAPVKGKIEQELLSIEKNTAKVRGLDPTRDVEEHFIGKAQLRDNMLALRDRSYTREDARQAETQLWLLRLIKQPSIGLYQLQADMLSNELAGYYDPSKKQLFILSSSTDLDAQAKTTLSHEYVHSLQDQHFDLSKVLAPNSRETDSVLAARSLVEGDATLTSVLYADDYLTRKEFDSLVMDGSSYSATTSKIPDIFQETLLFPYKQGVQFVKALYTRGGFATVNEAFSNPPRSTEQILHPEKYMGARPDEPLAVGVPPLTDTLGAGWTYRATEMIGELELSIMLKDNGIKSPDEAVAGWGGGQADLYEKGQDSLVILGTRWDTAGDAHEFDLALRKSLALVGRSGPYWSDTVRYFTVKTLRDKIYYLASTDADAIGRGLSVIK